MKGVLDMAHTYPTAASMKTKASTAIETIDDIALNKAIDYAASCGETSCLYQTPLADDVISTLESQGYVVDMMEDDVAHPGYIYKISWK